MRRSSRTETNAAVGLELEQRDDAAEDVYAAVYERGRGRDILDRLADELARREMAAFLQEQRRKRMI